MSNCKFSVTVSLAQGTEESMEQMLHGDGFPLGPPFDKIDQEAKKNKGDFIAGIRPLAITVLNQRKMLNVS